MARIFVHIMHCMHCVCHTGLYAPHLYVSGRRRGGNTKLHFTVIFVVACRGKGVSFCFDSSQNATALGLDQTLYNIFVMFCIWIGIILTSN